jgi:hypothetical protein
LKEEKKMIGKMFGMMAKTAFVIGMVSIAGPAALMLLASDGGGGCEVDAYWGCDDEGY